MKSNLQTIKSKQGEVSYRSKLVTQYQNKKIIFENEPNQIEIIQALRQRIKSTKQDFTSLKKQKVNFSPYLEIGAEFTHRAAVLEETSGASGFALDISLESLSLAPFFIRHLKLKKTPERICADAYHLPFQDNSINFVFCYQSLHHFPNPKPIIEEVYRVLKPNGHFFVNEEPISQGFNLNLWRRPTKLRIWEKILKYTLILPFISRIGKTETDHGILEETFNHKTWEKSLEIFENATVWLNAYKYGPETKVNKNSKAGWLKPSLTTFPFIFTLGGGIKILAQKGNFSANKTSDKNQSIISCPNCLKKLNPNLICPKCHTKYPQFKKIKLLLDKKLMKKLYPEL
jgi:ubiquinone/menaquinone biosynthesis C-methylase UbiE